MAETASRVRPLVEGDDAGGGDESRQAKRQAVEVIKLTGLSHDDVHKIGNDFSVLKLSVIGDLPPEVFGLVASYLGRQLIKPMLSTCSTLRAQGSSPEFWHALCKAHYPRVPRLLACMPPPHPPWRQLYLQQLRAERPLRFEAAGVLPPPTTSLSDYFYSVEIYGAPIHDEKQGPPLVVKSGRFGECTDHLGISAVQLWDEAEEPAWASRIVTDYRGSQSEAAWINSDGHRIASELRARIFITRPGDLKMFCLYDGFVGREPCSDGRDPEIDDGRDLFQVSFAKTALPLAGAAALDMRSRGVRYTDATVETTLYLRANRRHSTRAPLHDPAKIEFLFGNRAGDGELQFRFHVHGGLDFDEDDRYIPRVKPHLHSRDHKEIVRYFEWFAPF